MTESVKSAALAGVELLTAGLEMITANLRLRQAKAEAARLALQAKLDAALDQTKG
jgi:hypothetical protein